MIEEFKTKSKRHTLTKVEDTDIWYCLPPATSHGPATTVKVLLKEHNKYLNLIAYGVMAEWLNQYQKNEYFIYLSESQLLKILNIKDDYIIKIRPSLCKLVSFSVLKLEV